MAQVRPGKKRWFGSVFETKYKLVATRPAETQANHFLDVGRIRAQALKDYFLLVQARLDVREPALVHELRLPQPIIFPLRLEEQHRRDNAQPGEEDEVQAGDEAIEIHSGAQNERRGLRASKGDLKTLPGTG